MALPPFQTLIDAHATELHRLLVAALGAQDADDCYQETWVAALRAYPRLRDADNLRGWLLTIARRKAIDAIRARRRAAAHLASPPAPGIPAGAEVSTVRRTGQATGAGAGVCVAELAGADEADLIAERLSHGELWPTVKTLPAKQRLAVALRYVLDADYPTIASTLGVSVPAARRNVHEGLKRLRKEYCHE